MKHELANIWEGWCGSVSPTSPEGDFQSYDEVLDYVRDRYREWYWSGDLDEMTDAELENVAAQLWTYQQSCHETP